MSRPVIKTSGSYDRSYLAARIEAFKRSRRGASSICQACGWALAIEAHHWAGTPLTEDRYPQRGETTGDDLIVVCDLCHTLLTCIRRMRRYGTSRFEIKSELQKVIVNCDMTSK